MGNLHVESPCCRALVQRFGGRRRRCTNCGRTWSVWQRRRGPKRQRSATHLRTAALCDGATVAALVRANRPSAATRYRLRQAITAAVKRPRDIINACPPDDNLLLIADGVWYRFGHEDWVLYLLALRPVGGDRATFLDPILLPGHEAARRWRVAMATIPPNPRNRIVALISDGFKGSRAIAAHWGWVHQRCHFHLLARLHAWRGIRKPRVRGRIIRAVVFRTVQWVLTETTMERVHRLSSILVLLAAHSDCPRALAGIVREFLRERDAFRAYLDHPALHLPTTTGSAEAMVKRIRERTSTLCTPEALERWATATVRERPTIRCNRKEFQQK